MLHRRPRAGRTLPAQRWGPPTMPPSSSSGFNEGFAVPPGGGYPEQVCGLEMMGRIRDRAAGKAVPDTSGPTPASPDTAAAPLRSDHPEVRTADRGNFTAALDTVSSAQKMQEARQSLASRVFAKTTLRPQLAKLATWEKLAAKAGHPQGSFNKRVITDVMSALVKGKYRSADTYMIAAKQEYLRGGGHVSDHLKVIIKDAARAARRGIGPARQCPGYPVAGLGALADDPRSRAGEPASRDGPAHPKRATNVAAWFLMREIELSAVRRENVLEAMPGHRATLLLGEGGLKNATEGGVRRSLACICNLGSDLSCPCCDICHQMSIPGEPKDPLFPTADGTACSKRGVTKAYQHIAIRMGVDKALAKDITGHAGRVAGAMFLTRAGVSEPRLMAHARWG